jgi:putative acetyltransferase
MMLVKEDDLLNPQSCDLIGLHLASMGAEVPPGATFLGLAELQAPDVTVWSAWDGDNLAGIGALKVLADGSGEIKSMRTHPDHLGQGVGRLILQTIIEAGRAREMRRLSLETGSGPAFDAARRLYERFGFREGEAYASYRKTDFNRFLHLDLS